MVIRKIVLTVFFSFLLLASFNCTPEKKKESTSEKVEDVSGSVPRKTVYLGPGEGRIIQMTPDERFTVKAGSNETGGEFEFIELHIKPKAGPPEHIHKEQGEAFYILDGTFRIKIADRLVDAGPRSFVFIPPGTAHALVNTGEQIGTLLIVGSPVGLEAYFNELGEALRQLPPGPPDIEALAPILKKYKVEVVGPPLGM